MQETITLFQHGLWLAVVMSAPPLIVATLLGVSVSLLQAITQVQDQTLPYVVKLMGVAITLAVLGRWFTVELMKVAELVFSLIPNVGR